MFNFNLKVEECDEPDQMSKEKFREFLEDHPDFETLQARDEEIQCIVNILGDSGHSSHADIARYYVLEDGLLYRVTEPEKCGNHSGLQLVIPKFLQQPLIEEIHSGYFGGHLGIDKTYNKIRSRYYWSGMYRDVIEFLKNCVACNMRKLRRQRPPLQSMQIPQYPFEQIAIDTSGPFPESYEGNRYIINIIDMFSGWPEAFPTKSKSAETVAKILMEYIIPRHSCPRVIVSDNGTEFCNAVIDQINAFFNIKHITTSIYHPQANGKVERFNRVMSDALAKLVDRSQRDWDSKIPAILSAYRTAKNESTKFSPFYVIYGRDPVLPVDTLLAPKYRYQGEEYVPTMLENMHSAHHQVRHNLEQSHERNKVYYDRKAKPVNLKVGDMVYFRNPADATQSSKLSLHWKPFYRIIKALSDVTFVIKDQLSGGTKVVNANNLRLGDPKTLWKHTTEDPAGINSKYHQKDRSFIPLRIQPQRRSKLSVAADADVEPFSEPEPVSEPMLSPPGEPFSEPELVSEPIPAPHVEHSESAKLPPIPENLPDLPQTDSEPEPISSDEDEIPLAELQRRWREEQAQEEAEENLPLSELAKKLTSGKQTSTAGTSSVPVKRSRVQSESPPDPETQSPPGKYSKHDVSDEDSDQMDNEPEGSIGECVGSVNVNVKNTNSRSISKETLLSQLLTAHQSMLEQNKSLTERLLSQIEKL